MTLIAPRIKVAPAVCSGKLVIDGTRVPVSIAVGSIAPGGPFEDWAREHGLTLDDVRAALSPAGMEVTIHAARRRPCA